MSAVEAAQAAARKGGSGNGGPALTAAGSTASAARSRGPRWTESASAEIIVCEGSGRRAALALASETGIIALVSRPPTAVQ